MKIVTLLLIIHLLTSAIFNPFISGGVAYGGAILCNSDFKNIKLMKQITNWIITNGIHVSSFYCKSIVGSLPFCFF